MRPESLPLDALLLDPNNYRLQEQESYSQIDGARYHLERVQRGTLERLRQENLSPLRDSIFANGFLQIERIVVSPYEHDHEKYVVIEGNRRVAALMQLRSEYDVGIDIPNAVVAVFDEVPCLVADEEGQDAFFREAIMGIRHVGGIKEWGGFQRAKLIADLIDKHDLDTSSIAQRLGLSAQEVNRRYRAYNALRQMQEDEVFSEFAKPSMYPLFHEAVSLPTVRDWLGWNAETYQFENAETLESFYQLLAPRFSDDGEDRDPKITTYSQVRHLRDIIPNLDAKADLLNLDKEIEDAIAIATNRSRAQRWRNEVSEAKSAIQNIPGPEIEEFTEDDVKMLQELVDVTAHMIEMNRKLTKAGG